MKERESVEERLRRNQQEEQTRREEAQKQREEQRKKEEKDRLKMETSQQIIEEIKKIAGSSSKIHIKGKALDEIQVQDIMLGAIEYEDLEKAQEEQRNRERQERIKQRKLEAKKVDHLVRALREEEIACLDEWVKHTAKLDAESLQEVGEKQRRDDKTAFDEAQNEKKQFLMFIPYKAIWVKNKLEHRINEFEEKLRLQKGRLIKTIKAQKNERARERRREAREEIQREEEKLKKDEEDRKRAEEVARRKKEDEEKRRKENETVAIQKQKEDEVSAKYARQTNEETALHTTSFKEEKPRPRPVETEEDWRSPMESSQNRDADRITRKAPATSGVPYKPPARREARPVVPQDARVDSGPVVWRGEKEEDGWTEAKKKGRKSNNIP